MEAIVVTILVILCIMIYFIPAIKAYSVNHRQKEAIFILNLLGGLTGIGWLVAVVWAYMKEK